MSEIEMILMSREPVSGGYCIAGVNCADGRWVRLVSGSENRALTEEMLIDRSAGRSVGVLDRIRVETAGKAPGVVQLENMLVEGAGKIRIQGRAALREALKIHPCEAREELFGSRSGMIRKNPGHSLEIVRATGLRIYSETDKAGKSVRRMDFECCGRRYRGIAVSDPVYFGEREVMADEAALVLTISETEWKREGFSLIYAARIFAGPVEAADQMENSEYRSARRKLWTKLIACAVIAAVLAAAAAVFSMGMSYYAPDTGEKRHEDAQCFGLSNANKVYNIPTVIARMLFEPCMFCAGGSD